MGERAPRATVIVERPKRLLAGHPWVYSNEVRMDEAAKALPRGALVTLAGPGGRPLGTATFNPHTLVAARILDRDPEAAIDRDFFTARIARALALRQRFYHAPYYRLVHAEADRLPGLVVDRYGDAVVAQLNTAGMAALEPEILAALEATLGPRAVVLRHDGTAHAIEGVPDETRVALGAVDGPVELSENGAVFFADLLNGQKTGWFFDQRDNRRFAAALAKGGRALDVYCYGGAFAIAALRAGAALALGIDRSEGALALAARSAERNGVAERCRFVRADAFAELERLEKAGERFDIVFADPPAFVKAKKDLGPGLRGYRKLARLSGTLVAKDGILAIASCSHNVGAEDFAEAVRRGLEDAGRAGAIVRAAGAAPDHPIDPALPESAYLKSLTLALD
jgi:23S rRNA (cytosine1962-C5)-methyltransferase